jgi:hypothetical protein
MVKPPNIRARARDLLDSSTRLTASTAAMPKKAPCVAAAATRATSRTANEVAAAMATWATTKTTRSVIRAERGGRFLSRNVSSGPPTAIPAA